MKNVLVSVIVPVYKKEKTIKRDIENILNVMNQTRWDFEILPIIDGTSLDNSLTEINKIKDTKVRTYGYKNNKGKGYAVKYGMARAKGFYIAFIDAGMEIDPNGISLMLEHMQWYDADIIVASKRHPASRVTYTRMRKIYSWGYYLGVRLLFGLKISDTQTGLKVYKRQVLEKVLPRLLVKEFAFDIEVLAVAYYLGFKRIYTSPVHLSLDFSDSRFSKNKILILDPKIRKMLLDTLAVFYRLKILKYYSDSSVRKWVYDKDLDMKINTGEFYEE